MIAHLLEILAGLINSRSMHFHQNQIKFLPVQKHTQLGIKPDFPKDGVTNYLEVVRLVEGGFINSPLGLIQVQESREQSPTL